MIWYSGFLPYYNEAVKSEHETTLFRVGSMKSMKLVEVIFHSFFLRICGIDHIHYNVELQMMNKQRKSIQ